MNVSLPAIDQQSQKVTARNGKGSLSGEGQGFGKLLKSDGQAERGLAAQRSEEVGDARAKLAIATDEILGETGLPGHEAEIQMLTDGAEPTTAGTPEGEAPDDEPSDDPEAAGTEALLPLLTILDQRPAKAAPATDEMSAEADAGKLETSKARAQNNVLQLPAERRPQPTITVLDSKSADEPASQPPQAAFGKTLAANFGALASQAPDRPMPAQDLQTRTGQPANLDTPTGALEKAEKSERGTILAEAVKQASKTRETDDRRSETRPAAVEAKSAAPVVQSPAFSTGAPIVETLVAKLPLAATASVTHIPTQSASSGTLQSLKIQLHPAELGMVTARLRVTDGQLSIEVEVETSEAHNRLSGETEAIARALRSHGISVDQVVIQAPQTQANTSARDSTGTFADTSSSGAERNLSGGNDSGQSNGSGHADRNAGYDNGQDVDTLSPTQARAGGSPGRGVYI